MTCVELQLIDPNNLLDNVPIGPKVIYNVPNKNLQKPKRQYYNDYIPKVITFEHIKHAIHTHYRFDLGGE